jgi:hypothetical protein
VLDDVSREFERLRHFYESPTQPSTSEGSVPTSSDLLGIFLRQNQIAGFVDCHLPIACLMNLVDDATAMALGRIGAQGAAPLD